MFANSLCKNVQGLTHERVLLAELPCYLRQFCAFERNSVDTGEQQPESNRLRICVGEICIRKARKQQCTPVFDQISKHWLTLSPRTLAHQGLHHLASQETAEVGDSAH